MSKRVLVVHPNNSTLYLPHSEAVSMIERGHASWNDDTHKRVNVLPAHMRIKGKVETRGMSARFGEYLAVKYAAKDDIARVIVAHIRNQREAPSYEHAEVLQLV